MLVLQQHQVNTTDYPYHTVNTTVRNIDILFSQSNLYDVNILILLAVMPSTDCSDIDICEKKVPTFSSVTKVSETIKPHFAVNCWLKILLSLRTVSKSGFPSRSSNPAPSSHQPEW